ncbi:ATP-binding protein [Candidatus Magnetominusculus xianensis]|uniref:histidine kinase n=1 Tax=Candidatus Magnetominusculus xianensis TaxID=1748249 RepID=A0ABR5SGS9_9BACT|nr:ATP-binding protein [Candidatus Magnetominusculus xianensis]KWT82508.1 multi-sensor signal transduction histidine kinase [Candidatus Magnetominusculus xianensis]MBF0405412.1 response regulator [Nitrospirota bacterium]
MDNIKIQIVEDEALIALNMKGKIEGYQGFMVTAMAASGEDAIVAAERDRPDIVLMDIVLRGSMDGIEAAKEIKDRFGIPVIYLTAYSDDKIIEKAELTEPLGYLLKPCNCREMIVTIKMAMYKHKMDEYRKKAEDAERLRQEEKLLIEQAKLSAMGEMLRSISHNWRQPLNTLGLIVQDIEDAYQFGEINTEYLADFVKNAMTEINAMSETVSGYRNLFKPDKEKKPFEVIGAVNGVLDFLHGQIRSLSVDAKVIHSGIDALYVTGYLNEFRQVILNLMFNSMDAIVERRKALSHATIGSITIDIARRESMVMLKIIDDGGGVPEKLANRIFEPYFTTREQGKGVGVGLYVSKVLVENQMGGRLYFENVENGATFYVMFPETAV